MTDPPRVWFFYDNNREFEPTSVILSNDQAQSALLDDIVPLFATRISSILGTQITQNLSFWKLKEPRPSINTLPPDVPLETLAEKQVRNAPVSRYISHEMIELVVRWTPIQPRGEKRVREDAADLMMVKTKQAKLVSQAPSFVSRPSQFKSWHDKHGSLVDHRHDHDVEESPGDKPPHSCYPPISLQYEGFGHFLDVFRGREDVPGAEKVPFTALRRAVDKFADEMSHIFVDEFAKRTTGLDALNEIIKTHIDQPPFRLISAEISSKSSPEGHFLGPHKAACCVVEFKNESGTGTSIPYVEMASHFGHSINQAMMESAPVKLMMGWNVPCLGITIVGFHIAFYAMLFIGDGQWHVVSLTPGLSCIRAAGEGDDRTALYKAFRAASVLLAHIYHKATQVTLNHPPPIEGSRILPYISSLRDPHTGSRIEFKIDEPFFSHVTSRLLYSAKTTDGRKILVKFTRHYSYDLHLFCANQQRAPKLLGFERLPGGFLGVAMEFTESFSQIASFSNSPKIKQWAKLLQELVRSFHTEDLVHGDLRSPNILCDGERVMIVDFDWGGKEGEVYYPDVHLASDLTDGRGSSDLAITKDDDLRVLCKTLGYLCLECDYCRPRSS